MDDSSNPSALLALRILPHVCAYLPADTHLKCWGQNDYGQLGDGTTTQCTARPRSTSATLLGCWGSEEATLARTSRQAIVKCRGFKGYAARSSQIGDGTTTFRNTPTTINVGGAVGLLALGNSLTCESDGQHDPQVLGLHDRGGDCGSGSRLQELHHVPLARGPMEHLTDRVPVRSRVAGRYRNGNFLPAVAPPERLVDLDPRPRGGARVRRAPRAPGAAHPPHRAHIARSEPSERQSSRETITSQNSTAVYNEDKTRSNDLAPHKHRIREVTNTCPTRDLTRSRSPSSAHDGTNTSEVTNTCPHAREQHPAPTTTPTHPRSPNRRAPCPPAPLVVFV